jgi:hypothetical protein
MYDSANHNFEPLLCLFLWYCVLMISPQSIKYYEFIALGFSIRSPITQRLVLVVVQHGGGGSVYLYATL